MHTKDRLADELRRIGLTEMADKAAIGVYDDYLSTDPLPALRLANDLAAAYEAGNNAALGLRARQMAGDFDATAQEAEAWADSPDGVRTFKEFITSRRETSEKP